MFKRYVFILIIFVLFNTVQEVFCQDYIINTLAPKFLTLPLENPDAVVVNGWYYSKDYAPVDTYHGGIDYKASFNDPIVAAADGAAMTSSQYAGGSGYGKFVLIRHEEVDHGLNYFTLYAHVNMEY